MIFRWLYKRRLTSLFGPFVPEHTIKKITDGFSEWESFKLLLPRTIKRLCFKPVMSEIEALQAVQKMIVDALRDAPDVREAERRNSPAKPNQDSTSSRAKS
jgi:transposase